MATDAISRIHAAEQAAAAQVIAARARASELRQRADQDAEHVLQQARARAEEEARDLVQDTLSDTEQEAVRLQKQGREQAEILRHRLLQRTEEAAARIVTYVLP